jgi:2'-5' RNA ligase superfamily
VPCNDHAINGWSEFQSITGDNFFCCEDDRAFACCRSRFFYLQTMRKQLSMYLPAAAAREIEAVRRVMDPIQHRLIPAHITLCREDELIDLAAIQHRLDSVLMQPLTLRFGQPQIFSGHGVLLPCVAGEDAFRRLRETVLGSNDIREQMPHITLAHPRNPKAPGNTQQNASRLQHDITITFPTIFLIEQEGSAPWRVLSRTTLNG